MIYFSDSSLNLHNLLNFSEKGFFHLQFFDPMNYLIGKNDRNIVVFYLYNFD